MESCLRVNRTYGSDREGQGDPPLTYIDLAQLSPPALQALSDAGSPMTSHNAALIWGRCVTIVHPCREAPMDSQLHC